VIKLTEVSEGDLEYLQSEKSKNRFDSGKMLIKLGRLMKIIDRV
jgi:hypothetical protein